MGIQNNGIVPAGVGGGILKRNAANNGWEFKTAALGIPPTLLQTTFIEQTTDTITPSTTFVDLLIQTLTIRAGSNLLISATASVSNTSANQNFDMQITIDGTAVRGAGTRMPVADVPQGLAIAYRKTGLAAGVHTIKVQWQTSGGMLRVRPATMANEHASLLVQEVTV